MMRAMTLAAALLWLGCHENRAVDAEAKAEEQEKAVARYEAAELRLAAHTVDALKAEIEAREQAAVAAKQRLQDVHEALAKQWKGDPATMHSMISEAGVPADVAPLLEKAQQAAGSSAPEKVLEEALKKGALEDVAQAIRSLEEKAGINALDETLDAQGPQCERPKVEYHCRPLESEEPRPTPRLSCRSVEPAAGFVVSLEDSTLMIRRLLPDLDGKLKVVRSLGPDWWVVRHEREQAISGHSADTGTETSAPAWIRFLHLTDDGATERLALAAHEKVRFIPADLDGDGVDEIVESAPDLVKVAHYDRKSKDVALWSAEEACHHPVKAVEVLPSLKPTCEQVQRKEEEQAAAAARLARELAKAPQPQVALGELREAMLRCDYPAARQRASKALIEALEKDAKDRSKTPEAAFKELCDKVKENAAVVKGLGFGYSTVSGPSALVEVKIDDRIEKTPLVFEDGGWKLARVP
jgi:hypothetical protein